MDKYELARFARETGVNFGPKRSGNLVAFAMLVANAERDACARICDNVANGVRDATRYAEAIRGRRA